MGEPGRITGTADLLVYGDCVAAARLQRQPFETVAAGDLILIGGRAFENHLDPLVGRNADNSYKDDALGAAADIDVDRAVRAADDLGIGAIFIAEIGAIVADWKTACRGRGRCRHGCGGSCRPLGRGGRRWTSRGRRRSLRRYSGCLSGWLRR